MIDRTWLKWIAVLAMIVDHVGNIFFPQLIWMRIIGRIAFPIYAYCLVEGFLHTKDFGRYFFRMVLLAFLSELPFDLAMYGKVAEIGSQNVFFTLSLGLLLLYVLKRYENHAGYGVGAFLILGLGAELLRTDYGAGGLLMVCSFYVLLEKRNRPLGIGMFAATNLLCYGGIQASALLAGVPLYLYNGQPSKRKQRFFYWIYPLHLLLLWLVAKKMGIR